VCVCVYVCIIYIYTYTSVAGRGDADANNNDGREALRRHLPMGAPAGLCQRHAQPDERATVFF